MRISPLLILLVVSGVFSAIAETNRFESLTLEQALEIAERRHPQLAEAYALVEAANGRVQQAGAFPNPELILGAQQLTVESGASNQREYVAGIAQPIPIGGRLGKTREAERFEREVRARGLELTRRELRKGVHSAFAMSLYQDAAFQAQNQIAQGYEKAVATTKARVEAGDATREDLARIEMDVARANIELLRAQAMRDQSRVALAAALGDVNLSVKSLSGSLDTTFEIPTIESLATNLSAQPELLQAEASQRASEARIDLARAERIPDVRVEALYHRLEAPKENTVDVGLSIPLPLFNRNQGRVREARADAAAAEARARSIRLDLGVRLHESYAQLTTALARSRSIQSEILPRADTLLRATDARYAAGDISLNDALPVRRDWAVVQLTYLESLRDVMRAWAELSAYLKSP